MRIGFIGAGKAGNSLARYFAKGGNPISGFYSKTHEHSKQAADYVKSVVFLSLEDIVRESDIIFITTPDGEIRQVWEGIKALKINLKGKIFAHCSGSLSSLIFTEIQELGAEGCAVHPVRAISSRAIDLTGTFFTLDGPDKAVKTVKTLVEKQGDKVTVINPKDKSKYHGATAVASNLMVGLADMALEILSECGFDRAAALEMLTPLMMGNMESVCRKGPAEALTGAVERNDVATVEAHLNSLSGNQREIYRLLSLKLIDLAQEKNQERNYSNLKEKLEEKTHEKHSANLS